MEKVLKVSGKLMKIVTNVFMVFVNLLTLGTHLYSLTIYHLKIGEAEYLVNYMASPPEISMLSGCLLSYFAVLIVSPNFFALNFNKKLFCILWWISLVFATVLFFIAFLYIPKV